MSQECDSIGNNLVLLLKEKEYELPKKMGYHKGVIPSEEKKYEISLEIGYQQNGIPSKGIICGRT